MIDIVKNVIVGNKVKNKIKVVLLSDIHFSKYFIIDNLELIKSSIKKLEPDYICIAGDTIDEVSVIYDTKLINILNNFLNDLAKISKVFISLGNHDIKENKDLLYFKDLKIDNLYVLNNSYYIDKKVVINGYNMPREYYYNNHGGEDAKAMYQDLLKNKDKLYFSDKLFNISLIHSPINILDKDVSNYLKKCDLILCGHMHNGLVFRWLDKLVKNNYGLVSPSKGLFPDMARGYKKIGDSNIIISGGVTKLSNNSGKILRVLNRIYPISINYIEVVENSNEEDNKHKR